MKRILLLTLLVNLSFGLKAQTQPSGFPSPRSDSGFAQYNWIRALNGGIIFPTRDTLFTPTYIGTVVFWRNAGSDSALWIYRQTTGRRWAKVVTLNSGVSAGTVTSVGTNNGTGITGGAITVSGTLAIDTSIIATRLRVQKGIDSIGFIKLNISDTSAMLIGYLRVGDTSLMLQPYVRQIRTINTLAPLYGGGDLSADRTFGIDTGRAAAQVATGGSLNKVRDSLVALISGGGLGTVFNVSTTDGVGIISSVANPTSTPNISLRVDTLAISTKANVQKVKDSLIGVLGNYVLLQQNPLIAQSGSISVNDSINGLDLYGDNSISTRGVIRKLDGVFDISITNEPLTNNWTQILQNKSGTFAYLSDISDSLLNYVKYSDTAAQLSGYLRKGFALLLQDTATAFSVRPLNNRFLDSISSIRALANTKGTGTVTSVGLSLPAIFSVSGSPVTSSGTLSASLANQTANLVFASPTTGSPAQPTFRSLVAADLPSGTLNISDSNLYIKNQIGGNLERQTAKLWASDTIRTDGRLIGNTTRFVVDSATTALFGNLVVTQSFPSARGYSIGDFYNGGVYINLSGTPTTTRTVNFQDASGTVALTSDSTAILSQVVRTFGDQTVNGEKTFESTIYANTTSSFGIDVNNSTVTGIRVRANTGNGIFSQATASAAIAGTFASAGSGSKSLLLGNSGSGDFITGVRTADTTFRVSNTGKVTSSDSIVGANARFTGTINSVGQITSLSPIVSTSRSVGTTAFQAELSTSALNDSLVVFLGRSANGVYNLFDFTQYQRVANQSTGAATINIYDNGGKQRVQEWMRDSSIIYRNSRINGNFKVNFDQNATTEISIVNADNTNSTSRARLRAISGSVETILASLSTNEGYIGTSSNHALNLLTNGSNRITISTTGNVGIDESSPAQRLVVRRTGASNYLTVSGENNASYDIGTYYTDGTNNVFAGMLRGSGGGTGAYNVITGGSIRFTIASGGDITATGSITATGFIVSSDKRLKNIVYRKGDMVAFNWKKGDKKLHFGYIAQEVEKYLPNQVYTNEKGIKSVNYTEVHTFKIRQLEEKVEQLEKIINKIQNKLK